MPSFVSPLSPLSNWTLQAAPSVTVPNGLRYAGMTLLAMSARATSLATVQAPFEGPLRVVAQPSGELWAELQLNPFPLRRTAGILPPGAPTFYFMFDGSDAPPAVEADGYRGLGSTLGSVRNVTLAVVAQDRIRRDLAQWGAMIAAAAPDATDWAAFTSAVSNVIAGDPPLWLLDHTGQPSPSGTVVNIVSASNPAITLRLGPNDDGNLAVTYKNAGLAPASLWSLPAPIRVAPASTAPGLIQIAALDSGDAGQPDSTTVSLSRRHLQFVDLSRWYAPQFINNLPVSSLPRFTRGNDLQFFVNGKEFFDAWFRLAYQARAGGVHLAGWDMYPHTQFTKLVDGDPPDLPVTLGDLATKMLATGASRFLLSKHYQLENNAVIADPAMAGVALTLLSIAALLEALKINQINANAGALVALLLGAMLALYKVDDIVSSHGDSLEASIGPFGDLKSIPRTAALLARYPATFEDNPISRIQWTDLLKGFIRHFGVYHQKVSILFIPNLANGVADRLSGRHIAFCGGIDFNDNRLDDAQHLIRLPFHDAHARVEGPAARDLMLTFEERWRKESTDVDLAFPTPPATQLPATGSNIVQVARTYYQPATTASAERVLPFAPQGDRTLHDTLLQAIHQAKQFIYIEDQYLSPPDGYTVAMLDAATRVQKIIITCPTVNDQPFGDQTRSKFITQLQAANPGVVRVGYPRRHLTIPDAPIRAESGRVLLGAALPAVAGGSGFQGQVVVLGPAARVQGHPFWIACEGELMWAYGTADVPTLDKTLYKAFLVARGDAVGLTRPPADTTIDLTPRAHAVNAPAVVVDFTNIYVHSKLMIVDDVFLGLGSANLNRRGFFHDGEVNVFVVPQSLRAAGDNPVAALRRRLWAEWLDLPADLAAPLLTDPIAGAVLFERSPLAGTRHVDFFTSQPHMPISGDWTGGFMDQLIVPLVPYAAIAGVQNFFDTVVDPTSSLDL